MTTAAPRPNAGLLGGRYQLLKHLASGGMAEVHLARATGIGGFARHVVVKRILPEHARDARFVTMFLDEARLAAQLHHQNVVQVYDIGEDDGSYFFAMEYVHGVDLREVLRAVARQRGQLPIEHALAIVAGAAAGLHHAHDRLGPDRQPLGLVHRDVSLSNILLAYDGAVKVVDFGIAKAATRTTETGSGTLKGKVTYMSPEQCQGKPLDRRSDVFALGIVLYELTTVTRLFSADNDYATMHQIVAQDVPPPSSRRADYPPGLEPIVLRALARDVDARYASAGALLEAIEGYAAMRGLTMSPAALGRWVRDLLGERPEPWHDLGSATGPPVVVSLLEGSLPEVIVAQTESSLSAISGVRLPGSPAVAAEVADVAAVQAASAVAAPAAPVAAAAPRRARWPWIVALGLASAAAGGAIALQRRGATTDPAGAVAPDPAGAIAPAGAAPLDDPSAEPTLVAPADAAARDPGDEPPEAMAAGASADGTDGTDGTDDPDVTTDGAGTSRGSSSSRTRRKGGSRRSSAEPAAVEPGPAPPPADVGAAQPAPPQRDKSILIRPSKKEGEP